MRSFRKGRVRTSQLTTSVGLDLSHPAFGGIPPTFAYNAASGLRDLANNTQILETGTVSRNVRAGTGINAFCTSTADDTAANYLYVEKNRSPPEARFSVIACASRDSGAYGSGIFSTSDDASNYEGIWATVDFDGTVVIGYGDGTGLTTANRKTFTTTAAAFVGIRRLTGFAATVRSDTEAAFFSNGAPVAYTAAGTATSYSPGDGTMSLHRSRLGAANYGYTSIGMLVIIPTDLPDALLRSLSVNPWQLFEPEEVSLYVTSSGPSFKSYWAARSTQVAGVGNVS